MLSTDQINALGLYLRNQVCISLENGETVIGKLKIFDPVGQTLQVDTQVISFSDVIDVEYIGEISDYHTIRQFGQIDRYTFQLDALTKDFDPKKVLYCDFDCKIACHLIMCESGILAVDIRPLELLHHLNTEILCAQNHLYKFHNGTYCIGQLTEDENGYNLRTITGECIPLDRTALDEITKAPEKNDYVIVTKPDASVVSGLVSATDETDFVIIRDSGIPAIVTYEEIAQLRYRGQLNTTAANGKNSFVQAKITVNSSSNTTFLCKQAYFRTPTELSRFRENAVVTFVAGVSRKGMIAKDVVPDAAEPLVEPVEKKLVTGVGVITFFDKKKSIGYIGEHYVTKGYSHLIDKERPVSSGKIIFNGNQLDFQMDFTNISVVSYSYYEGDSIPHKAVSVNLVENFSFVRYAHIKVTPDGKIDAVPTHIAYLPLFVNQEVEITLTDRTIRTGWLQTCENKQITLQLSDTETPVDMVINFADIEYVRAYGSIGSYRHDNGLGYIDNYWFHINNLRNNTESTDVVPGRRVLFSLVNTNKGKFCMADDISVIKEVPLHGYLTGYNGTTCKVYPASDYGKTLTPIELPVGALRSDLASRLNLLNLNQYDFPITYIIRKKYTETYAVISHVELNGSRPKVQLGYVFKYIRREGGTPYGFIVLPEDLEIHLKNPSEKGSVHFNETNLLTDASQLDTTNNYYSVAFSMNSSGAAITVAVLEEFPLHPVNTREEITETVPEQENDVQKYPLSEFLTKSQVGDNYRFGLINYCSTRMANVNNRFINRKLNAEEEYSIRISFNPEACGFIDDFDLKTQKYSYLVRYVPTQTEEPGVDESYPIEVLHAFPKQNCVRISLEEEYVVVENLKKQMSLGKPSLQQSIPDPEVGESLFLILRDQTMLATTYEGETEDGIIVAPHRLILRNQITKLYRFAVVTGLDMDAGIGVLNGMVNFSLDVAEPKMVNVLKNQVNIIRLHVMYSYQQDTVTEVRRIPELYADRIPWVLTRVENCIPTRQQLITEDGSRHFLSVMTDNMIVNLFKQEQLAGCEVYVRSVNHLFQTDGKASLVKFAIKVHGARETATIQYDAGTDNYLAYRNQTKFFTLSGNEDVLRRIVGNPAPIEFTLDQSGVLRAYLGDLSQEEALQELLIGLDEAEALGDMEEPAVAGVSETSLAILGMRLADKNRLVIPDVELNENGMPADSADAMRAYTAMRAVDDSGSLFMAANLAQQYPDIPLLGKGSRHKQIGSMIMWALRKRCREIGTDANACFGELTYYLTTLLHRSSRSRKNDHQRFTFLTATECLYLMLLMDFGTRQELSNQFQSMDFAARPDPNKLQDKGRDVDALLKNDCHSVEEFTAHLMQLDKTSAEAVVRLLEDHVSLRTQVIQYASKVEDTIHEQKLEELVQTLREKYARDKSRFRTDFENLFTQSRVCEKLCELIGHMRVRFLKLTSKDDALRFERLFKCCQRVVNYTNKFDFMQQEIELKSVYHEICELEKEVLAHPTQDCVELLILNRSFTPEDSIFSKVRTEIASLLNQLYQNPNTMPRITCQSNDSEIAIDHPKIWLVIKNGTENMNIQPADNLTISLESYSEDVSVPETLTLSQNHLAAGEQVAVEVDVEISNPNVTKVELGWSAKYDYVDAFVDGVTIMRTRQLEQTQSLEFLVGTSTVQEKNLSAPNPYEEPALGHALKDNTMFFGRKEEKKLIWDSIVQKKDGQDSLIPGSAVIIHGQKKCGKTSLVYQIRNEIAENESLRKQAIVLEFNNILGDNGGAESLEFFSQTFYRNIITAFRLEIHKNHPDVEQMLRDNDVEVPSHRKLISLPPEMTYSYFDAFFKEFALYDQGKHVIFLVMDEFTLLCTTILSQLETSANPSSIETIPNFIKTFSQYGFVQLIIGHEAMMRALGTLGVLNHTSEFAKSVEISALAYADAEELVRLPMIQAFGSDVYGTILGQKAVQELLDLSGCSPTYLMRLCDKMFKYYVDPQKCPRNHILPTDVEHMIQEYVQNLLLKDFDVLLVEDGDEVEALDSRATFKFLKSVADISEQSFDHRTADITQVKQYLERINREYMRNPQNPLYFETEQFDTVRNLLEARRVISTVRGGRIQIRVGLFCRFISQKYGGK